MDDTTDLPELADMPEEAVTPASTQHAADWASTFGGSDTNLAQRVRHNQDITAYTSAVQQAQQAHFMDSLAADKGKQDLYFRQKALDASIDSKQDALAQRQAQFDATLDARKASQDAGQQLQMLKLQHAKVAADHTAEFSDAISSGLDSGIAPNTKAYQDLAVASLLAHPSADPNLVNHVFGQAKLRSTPDEVIQNWNSIPQDQKAATTFYTNADGTIGFKARNITPVEQSHIDSAVTNAATNQQKEARLQAKAEADAKLIGIPAPAPVAPVVPASVVDRVTLAKQALSDPAASEQHKAAAKAILGIK